jgi:uncharacterized protein (TIGR03435 family)
MREAWQGRIHLGALPPFIKSPDGRRRLLWRPEVPLGGVGNNPPPPSDSDGRPDIYTAIQQQLGLRLEATKTPTEVILVDHVEKPSEN